jgi:hypothetical protein
VDLDSAALQSALTQACADAKLDECYRDCVRPLLRDPEGRWPSCCGSRCEPCNAVLCRAAARTLERMGAPRRAPLPNPEAS